MLEIYDFEECIFYLLLDVYKYFCMETKYELTCGSSEMRMKYYKDLNWR